MPTDASNLTGDPAHSPASGPAAAGALSAVGGAGGAGPFQRMRRALEASRQLGEALAGKLLGEGVELPMETLEREMQVG